MLKLFQLICNNSVVILMKYFVVITFLCELMVRLLSSIRVVKCNNVVAISNSYAVLQQ